MMEAIRIISIDFHKKILTRYMVTRGHKFRKTKRFGHVIFDARFGQYKQV